MHPDGRFQHFIGKRHEAVFNLPKQRGRPFDKAADFIQQRIIGTQTRPVGSRQCRGTFDNGRTAGGGIHHHMGTAQKLDIIIRTGNAGQVQIAAMFKIMTSTGRGEFKAATTKIQRPGKRCATKHHIHPVQRPHPAETRGTPALAFRPGKLGQNRGDHIWQQGGGIRPGAFDPGKQEGAFRRVLGNQLRGQAGRFQKAFNGLVRRIGPGPRRSSETSS